MSISPKSVLVIGASGRLGLDILHEIASRNEPPEIHAFCRDPSKLATKDRSVCTSVIQGNARNQEDIEKALDSSGADLCVISVGNGDNVGKTDIRAVSAQALAGAMAKPEYGHVRTVVVSSNGAGGSRIKVALGIGRIIEIHLRHVLKDHDRQEEAFKGVKDRTDIVRPTGLKNGKATGKVQEFGNLDRCPNVECDRKDVAKWIVEDIYSQTFGGKAVNIATKN